MKPELLFTPYAWKKLVYLRDLSDNEVGALGVSVPGKPLVIADLLVPKQLVSWVSVAFDMDNVSDLYADMSEKNRPMEEFARVWIHTHPGSSATPSGTDENTFMTNYGTCNWSVMFILAKSGATTACLRLKTPQKLDIQLGVGIDWTVPFDATDEVEWKSHYAQSISVYVPPVIVKPTTCVTKSANVRDAYEDAGIFTAEDLWEDGSADWWANPEDMSYEDVEDELFQQELKDGKA